MSFPLPRLFRRHLWMFAIALWALSAALVWWWLVWLGLRQTIDLLSAGVLAFFFGLGIAAAGTALAAVKMNYRIIFDSDGIGVGSDLSDPMPWWTIDAIDIAPSTRRRESDWILTVRPRTTPDLAAQSKTVWDAFPHFSQPRRFWFNATLEEVNRMRATITLFQQQSMTSDAR